MEFDHHNVRRVVQEDRLSSLPDELIHQILSCLDMKFAVQTCLLSSRWKLLWTSMPRLNFSSREFRRLRTFAKFVTRVLSHRNHQIDVFSVKLNFHGAVNQGFVSRIAKYAFSHNVQQLSVVNYSYPSCRHDYSPCLFSSHSLKHFKLTYNNKKPCITTKTPWGFPALTTLHLSRITLCDNLFTSCVNLKNLTLINFNGPDVYDIVTPQLSKLILREGHFCKVMNVIAPQLESVTIDNCSIKYLNIPPGISSLCYTGYPPMQLSKDGFHSLNKVSVFCSSMYKPLNPHREENARNAINMLQELHSARYLTLNANTVVCLSSFPELLSKHSSPFSNLECLTIDYKWNEDAYKVPMSGQVRNFLLENSPSATLIKKLSKVSSRR